MYRRDEAAASSEEDESPFAFNLPPLHDTQPAPTVGLEQAPEHPGDPVEHVAASATVAVPSSSAEAAPFAFSLPDTRASAAGSTDHTDSPFAFAVPPTDEDDESSPFAFSPFPDGGFGSPEPPRPGTSSGRRPGTSMGIRPETSFGPRSAANSESRSGPSTESRPGTSRGLGSFSPGPAIRESAETSMPARLGTGLDAPARADALGRFANETISESGHAEEDLDDCGDFSYYRPMTGEPDPHPYPPGGPALVGYVHPASFPFAFGPLAVAGTSAPDQGRHDVRPLDVHDASLSPAAAYAQDVQSDLPNPPERSAPPQSSEAGRPSRRAKRRRVEAPAASTSARRPEAAGARRTSKNDESAARATRTIQMPKETIELPVLGATAGYTPADELKDFDVELSNAKPRRRRAARSAPLDDDDEDSPYPQVQASVSNKDDRKATVLTFRVWAIGLTFAIVVAAINCFFSMRYPAPILTPILTQLLSYPIGKFMASAMSGRKYAIPPWAIRMGAPETFAFNPGPFSIKEHTLIVIMANISNAPAWGLNYSLAAEYGFGQYQPVGFDILLTLTTQAIGFGLSGLLRRFLVWPASMLWPTDLVFCTLLNTFHAELDDDEPGMSRFRFFTLITCGAFMFYWIPGFLFTALSVFSYICWIAPDNVVLNQLFGVSTGLGMGVLTFDWTQVIYAATPLVVPWWAQVNVFLMFAFAFWFLAPILYYTNAWDVAYLPMVTSAVFDRFGQVYNTSRVIDPATLLFDKAAYEEYSPLYLPISLVLAYFFSAMLATAVLVHTALYYGPEIWSRLRPISVEDDDVHMRLMRKYPEVPDWWYFAFLVVAVGMSISTIAAWFTSMPVWALFIALAIGGIYLLPGGIVFATTTYPVSINLITELIGGYIMPGKPLANMLFKTYTTQIGSLGLYFVQDLKLGHYMKIPPRVTFLVQIVSVFVTAFVQVGVKRWLMGTVEGLCTPDQHSHLVCPYANTFKSAGIIWGLVGPSRLFSSGQRYHPILWSMLAGAILPCMTWLLARRYPRSWLAYVNLPVMLSGIAYIPPASGLNYAAPFLVGFIFQYVIRLRHFDWWTKYNFLLSAGLDAGTILSGVLIFLTLQLPKGGNISLNWWGNEVYMRTADWLGTPLRTPPPDGFGPTSW